MSVYVRTFIASFSLILIISFLSCGGKSGGDEGGGGGAASSAPGAVIPLNTISGCASYPCGVTIAWAQHPNAGVHAVGGGYKLYWKKDTGAFTAGDADGFVDVGSATSSSIPLEKGTWYVRMCAYSTVGGSVNESALSDAMGVIVQ